MGRDIIVIADSFGLIPMQVTEEGGAEAFPCMHWAEHRETL